MTAVSEWGKLRELVMVKLSELPDETRVIVKMEREAVPDGDDGTGCRKYRRGPASFSIEVPIMPEGPFDGQKR